MAVGGLMRGSEPVLQVGCWRWGDRGAVETTPLSSQEQDESKGWCVRGFPLLFSASV